MTPLQPAASGALPFADRHIGPRGRDLAEMLDVVGQPSLASLIESAVPQAIRQSAENGGLDLPAPASEARALVELAEIAESNQVLRSFIGMGYHGAVTPPVIQRNVLENPGWYTAYTPYQPEISQGRLEALLNFQTMITSLTGLDIANASLLDEPTAAAEAMSMCWADKRRSGRFFVSAGCHPQTIEVVRTRAAPLGIQVEVGDHETLDTGGVFAALIQQPSTCGAVLDYRSFAARVRAAGGLIIAAADPLALCLLEAPGEWGADIAVGSTQRFGLPMGFGGPHAAYIAVRDRLKRRLPGRLVGVTRDDRDEPALRLALQTREQHIRRDRATSNICTAQVLPAVVASFYAVYHGPEGLESIARTIHRRARRLAERLKALGLALRSDTFFDTVTVHVDDPGEERRILAAAVRRKLNLRGWGAGMISVACDETTTDFDVESVLAAFAESRPASVQAPAAMPEPLPESLRRATPLLDHPVFSSYRSETELLRYLYRLEARDLSLTTSMIPLGSCTMKLNATAEMMPMTWRGFAHMHPYAPAAQTAGYQTLCADLERWLAEITGFDVVSLQPNAGSQGEYAGLLAIRAYHERRGEGGRDVCLIPTSAHGTNPASAVLAGMRVAPVACDDEGNIHLDDLREQAETHGDDLAALMVTYPSTHGVFEEAIREICAIVHRYGGQIYLDGANMNAQVGVCRPGDYGADVCHLNLHKTFCIPHGGGGPGMGPIAAAAHLAPYLPRHPLAEARGRTTAGTMGDGSVGAVSGAAVGSGSILPISWAYIRMMGSAGLRRATEIAILNANYVARRLEEHYPVLYRGEGGLVAHECILDLRAFRSCGVEVDDVAKRLIDYGFHAPTMSFPVAGTLMVEPTESESKAELDRFCDAMIAIRAEIAAVECGETTIENSPLRGAPHTAPAVISDDWDRPYSRRRAAYPAPWNDEHKYWPPVGRVDNAHGDRNLICTCVGMEDLLRDAASTR